MKVEIISCLQDNYSYLIIDETNNLACIVDPSEASPIIDYLKNKNINLKNIIVLLLALNMTQKEFQKLISVLKTMKYGKVIIL